MLANTRLLFLGLLGDLRIDRVCDVGSLDGSEALAFRRRLPRAEVLALEPHPDNLARMRADARLRAAGIRIVGAAASDRTGAAPFHLVDAEIGAASQLRARRGMSSLHRRSAHTGPTRSVEVQTLRLDAVLGEAPGHIALWIDVEGKAYEAIEGLGLAAASVQLIHVELESQPCIADSQHLAPEVHAQLRQLGFELVATDWPLTHPQFNAVYLRRGQPVAVRRQVARRLWRAHWRRRLVLALQAGCPACVARLIAWRDRFGLRVA